MSDAELLAFVRADLIEGRHPADPIAHGEAWESVLERAATLMPATIDALIAMAAEIHGSNMRGLVALLREALPADTLSARARGTTLAPWLAG